VRDDRHARRELSRLEGVGQLEHDEPGRLVDRHTVPPRRLDPRAAHPGPDPTNTFTGVGYVNTPSYYACARVRGRTSSEDRESAPPGSRPHRPSISRGGGCAATRRSPRMEREPASPGSSDGDKLPGRGRNRLPVRGSALSGDDGPVRNGGTSTCDRWLMAWRTQPPAHRRAGATVTSGSVGTSACSPRSSPCARERTAPG